MSVRTDHRSLRQTLNKRTRLKDSAIFLQTQTLGLIKSHHQRLAGITEALKAHSGCADSRIQKIAGGPSRAFKENYLFAPSKFKD